MSTYCLLLAQILIVYVVDGQFRTCIPTTNPNTTCKSTTITCDDTQPDCILSCTGDGACHSLNFVCTGEVNGCHLECSGPNACKFANITSSVSTSIHCDGDSAVCNGATTTTLQPFGVYVTAGSKPVSVNMTCDKTAGWYGCKNVDIIVSGTHPSNQLNVYCSEGAFGGKMCDDMIITCGFDNSQCEVECETGSSRSCDSDCTLECPNNGIGTTCNIVNEPNVGFNYLYTFSPSVSPTSTTNSPTNAPSISPSNAPTQPPSNSPTQPPSFSPSSVPSLSPTMAPSNAPTQPPSIAPSVSPSNIPSNYPSLAPSSPPTNVPSNAPTNPPSNAPTQPPSLAPSSTPSSPPSGSPSDSPSNTPTQPPSTAPSVPPSIAPSNNPSMIPSVAPSFSPTLRPTSYEDMNNILSNYVMNDDFGIDNFNFPAAIGQCMQYQYGSEQFMQYECITNDTAIQTIYSDDACNDNSIISIKYYNTSTHELRCNGEDDTYIELELYSNNGCPQIDSLKSTIFIADGVCTSYGSINDNYYRLYCTDYKSPTDSNDYLIVFFQYYNDKCSIYGFTDDTFIEGEPSSNCPNEQQNIFNDFSNSVYIEIVDCSTANFTNNEETTTTSSTTTLTPSKFPTPAPIIQTTHENDDEDDQQSTLAYDATGYIVVGLVIVFPMSFILVAFLVHRKRKGSDRPGYISLFKFFSSVGDFYTDAIWSLTLFSIGDSLYLWAFLFTFGPHVLSIIIGLIFITKWRQTKSKKFISEYAERFDKVIIILTLVSGFYAAVEILTSHLFHLDVFSLQISDKQRSRIMNMKIVNNVILENVPCVIIQYLYLTSSGSFSVLNSSGMIDITILAMIFSVAGIIFGVLTIIERVFNGCIDCIRYKHNDNLKKIDIEFTLRETKPGIISNYHSHTHFLLTLGIHLALHIQFSQIIIVHVQKITDGIKVKAKFTHLDYNNAKLILAGLQNQKSENYLHFHKECCKKLQLEAEYVKLDIYHIKGRYDDTDGNALNSNSEIGYESKTHLTTSIEMNKIGDIQEDATPVSEQPLEDNFED